MSSSAANGQAAVVHRFATLGDSITAGTARDSGRLWPALVKDWLAARCPEVRHLSLAVGGAASGDVLRDQVPRAIAGRPDLATVICGGNDVLYRPRPDIDAAGANLSECLGRLAQVVPRGRIVTATYPNFVPLLPFRPRSRIRVTRGLEELNQAIRQVARTLQVMCVDLAALSQRFHGELYAADGTHPSQIGHEWIAIAMTMELAMQLGWPDARRYWEAHVRYRSLDLPPGVIPF